MFGIGKKKETWTATFKTLGSTYSYAKVGDLIVVQEPDSGLSEIQFSNKLEEARYKYNMTQIGDVVHANGIWQAQLERD
jgi:hypothetical protein